MSVRPDETTPDPRTVAANLKQRLLDEGKPGDKITITINIWDDGDFRVKVYHGFDDSDGIDARIQYIRRSDGSMVRQRVRLTSFEAWETIDEQEID